MYSQFKQRQRNELPSDEEEEEENEEQEDESSDEEEAKVSSDINVSKIKFSILLKTQLWFSDSSAEFSLRSNIKFDSFF